MATKVYLIGAGPGDPELLTLRGQKLLKKADVVIYDYLVSKKILGFIKKTAEKISVSSLGGLYSDRSPHDQEAINRVLIQRAKQNKLVIRLKNGDPYLFGRGGVESEILAEAGIAYEVVPGITAAVAAAGLFFIPLTDRRFASSVTFVTGHGAAGKADSDIDWQNISRKGTLVFYMGVENLSQIVEKLKRNGRGQKTPVAIVERVSLPAQKLVEGNLGDIVAKAGKRKLSPPAIIIVGEVVALRKKLCEKKSW